MTPAEGIEYLQKIQERDPTMPVFVLIAPDMYAPAAVNCWAILCASQGSLNAQKHEALKPTRDKGERAMHLAAEMRDYQRKNGSKMPD